MDCLATSLFACLFAVATLAQDPLFEKVKAESVKLRDFESSPAPTFSVGITDLRKRSAPLHAAIRDWVESRLPLSLLRDSVALSELQRALETQLKSSGLWDPNVADHVFKPGLIRHVLLSQMKADASKLAVIAGVTLPCGTLDAVYLYDYSQGTRRRVLESIGSRETDEELIGIVVSRRDSTGSQLILTLRYATQCGSSWNGLNYDLFRLSSAGKTATRILSGKHGIWFGTDPAFQMRLEPDELLLEIRDRSIDPGIHSRAHVLRFKSATGGSTMDRVDPVALQPQDFVDEWLTRDWAEMQSRTSNESQKKLKEWHATLASDFVSGDFLFVQPCQPGAGKWQVAIDLDHHGKRRPVYILVEELGRHRYRMNGISFDRQPGCPGEQPPSFEIPSLFPNKSQ